MKRLIEMSLDERKEYIRKKAIRKVMKKQEILIKLRRGDI